MMLKAKVKKLTGAIKHHEATVRNGFITKGRALPSPSFVEIVEIEGGFLLVQLDENGNVITDSWQATLEDAKGQAKFEFNVDEADWSAS